MPGHVRVVLVEDHDMVAEGIEAAFGETDDIEVVHRAGTVAEAVAAVRRHQPDVVLLDRRLPDGDGVAAMGDILVAAPASKVLVLTGEASSPEVAAVVAAGGSGLVLKTTRLDELVAAVRATAAGERVFPPGVLGDVLDRLTGRATAPGADLTERECQTLTLLAEGVSTAEIGERLHIAHNTVRNHVQRALTKLGAHSQLEAVAIARRQGIIR